MIFAVLHLLFGAVANAGDCPKQDLYAHKLDAYIIEVGDDIVKFKIKVDIDGVEKPEVESWQAILQYCQAEKSIIAFDEWRTLWDELSALGIEYQAAQWIYKLRIRKKIRQTEKEVALQYARMLQSFERETGISILWNTTANGHPLAKGMVSAGRGSEKVYEYIFHQYNVQ